MLDFNGLQISANRDVYEPREDSKLASEVLLQQLDAASAGLKVLDLGTGSGVLGLVAAASSKVNEVTFADINPEAVRLAMQNAHSNRDMLHAKCGFQVSDLFSEIKDTFDLVLFNAPYLPDEEGMGKRKTPLSLAFDGGKEGIDVALRFLDQLGRHLNPEAKVLLVMSSLGNLEKLEDQIGAHGMRILSKERKHMFFEDIVVYTLSN